MRLLRPKDLITSRDHAPTYYADSVRPRAPRPALMGEQRVDVCVVGAGFSGLSTALHLAERGYRVAVVEAVRVGYGATGRNGGQIVNGYSRDDGVIRKRYGDETADALLAMSHEGGDIIRQRIQQYGIDCDFKRGGFFAAFNQKQLDDLSRRRDAWARAGNTNLHMVPQDKMPHVVASDLYVGGLLDLRGGHLHPLKLAEGEAAAIESHGGVIFEQSRVLHIEAGRVPVVHTETGSIFARQVVVCGNAYLGGVLPQLSQRIMAVSSQIVTTEVLGAAITDRLMPEDYCLEDCNFLLDYYRITGDKRLLFGGGVVYSGADPSDIVKRLYPHIVKTFPQLKGVQIDYAWSGHFALTLTRMPQIGRYSDSVYFIQGDSGHGVTTTHLLGRLVAESIAGQNERFDVFANLKTYPFPGGRLFRVPLTAMGAWYYALREKIGI